MGTIKIELTEKKLIEVTPRLLAEIFWNLNHQEQADFFDHLGNIAGDDLEPQLWHAVHASEIDDFTRDVMREFGKALVQA